MKIFFKESLLEISKLFSEVLEPVYLTTILPTLCSSFSFFHISAIISKILLFKRCLDLWSIRMYFCRWFEVEIHLYFFQMHNQLSQNKLIVFTPLSYITFLHVCHIVSGLSVLLSVSSSVAHCLTYCSFMKSYYWVGQVFFVSFFKIVLALCFFTLILRYVCQVLMKAIEIFL